MPKYIPIGDIHMWWLPVHMTHTKIEIKISLDCHKD